MNETSDVVIVGGGLVGASLAVALAHSPLRVTLVEAALPPASPPAWDERCIALNDASRRIFAALGLWDALAAEAEPITATHISERGRFGTTRFDAREAGLEALGYNLPLRAIGAALTQALAAAPNLALIQPARVIGISANAQAVSITIEHEAGATATLDAKLVVAADGARSALRELLGIAAQTRDYAQHALVSAVRLARPHRGVAYERFTPDGPLALIPKPEQAASLVWTVASAQAETLLALSDADYLAAAQDLFGGRLGRFAALGARRGYALSRVMSEALTAPRTVFIGNAAQSLHPVAAQGFNLGLRDVAALAERLAGEAAADPGAAIVLADYEQARARDRGRVSDFTDALVRTFSNRLPGLSQARHWGLVAVDLAPPLRAAVLRQHLGQLGFPRTNHDQP
ncbi:MAG: 2-octaprenyl-6-methoxyphenyl hydroxylase [Nevskia sp.]